MQKVRPLLLKIALLLIPLFLLTVLYMLLDPFKVIWHYSSYYESGKASYVSLNRDFVSFETFRNNNPGYDYDAFIFGNSRSMFYLVDDWKQYIASDKCFHFDGSDESLYGVNKKVKYLDENNINLKYALLIFDYDLLEKTRENEGLIFRKHPKLSEHTAMNFQLEFFKSFLDYKFLFAFLDFKLSGDFKPYMAKTLNLDTLEYNLAYNEPRFTVRDRMISRDEDRYYEKYKSDFYHRDTIQRYYSRVIKEGQQQLLNEIMQVFRKQGTKYKIIISPAYNQKKLHPSDIKQLELIFGKKSVYDFAGINPITNNIRNYYEHSHYRPHVTRYILSEIYKNQK